MRRRMAFLIVALLALVAGCGPDLPAQPVAVDGSESTYSRPDITFIKPLIIDEPETTSIWEGSGEPLADGEHMLLHYRALSALDGTVIGDTYDTGPKTWVMSPELPTWLYQALHGAKVGARILRLEPGPPKSTVGTETQDPDSDLTEDGGAVPAEGVIVVFDILPMRAEGESVPEIEGLPKVTLAKDGEPAISIPEGAVEPTGLTVQTLMSGPGPQVENGQQVTIQYVAKPWGSDEIYDSTWAKNMLPATFQIGGQQIWAALDSAILEQSVGSQILVVAPESQAVPGSGTMVIVVDILAVSGDPIEGE